MHKYLYPYFMKKIKPGNWKPFLFSVALIFSLMTLANPAPNICGIWLSKSGDYKVEIYKNGNTYEGKLLWLKKGHDANGNPLLDKDNPDPNLRSRPLVGMKVLWNARYNSETGTFDDGTAYKNGHTFCGKMKLNHDGTLKVTGYICALRFLKKSDTLIRIN